MRMGGRRARTLRARPATGTAAQSRTPEGLSKGRVWVVRVIGGWDWVKGSHPVGTPWDGGWVQYCSLETETQADGDAVRGKGKLSSNGVASLTVLAMGGMVAPPRFR
jgi:hypothetical protein